MIYFVESNIVDMITNKRYKIYFICIYYFFKCRAKCHELPSIVHFIPTIDHLYIQDLILKLNSFYTFLYELFPFNVVKRVPFHAKFIENNIYIPHKLYNILIL